MTSIVEAIELLVEESSAVIVVGIVVAIAVIVGRVNYAFFLTHALHESAPLAL